ncbi:MAG TPA: lysozyme [Rhodopila sp.]|jgi:lysozyme
MSPAAVDLAAGLCRAFEGCVLEAYRCPAGVWTIGVGSTRLADGSAVCATTPPITDAVAEALLQSGLRALAPRIEAIVTVPLADNEAAALLSFAYNLGVANLRSSTLRLLLNQGDRAGAAAQFALWCHAGGQVLPGLVRRRAAEAAMFSGQAATRSAA